MQPSTETELSEAIRGANGPLAIRGGGTRPVGRPGTGEALSTAGLAGVRLYEPGALTLVVGAGTPVAEVEALLAAEGQRLPFEPMDHRGLTGTEGTPTVGGMVAANASGPRRVQAGACRDSMIGVRFVDGSGAVIKNGGRVMKNVTGYDLVKLMAGSWGTLGVLTEVAFKLLPAPPAAATLRLAGLEDGAAVKAMASALTSPFEVSGAAHLPGQGTFLRLEGLEAQVAYRAGRLVERLAPFGAVEVERDPQAVAATWAGIRDVAAFHGAPGDVWRVSVKPSDGPAVAARAGAEAVQYDWGGGLVWLRVPEGTDLRARLGDLPGHATLVRASAETRARLQPFHPEPAPVAALSSALRAKFDPRGILNPGLMAP
ncbi:MAG: FAD-binding protein [Alkalilacustris sp.]